MTGTVSAQTTYVPLPGGAGGTGDALMVRRRSAAAGRRDATESGVRYRRYRDRQPDLRKPSDRF
jgi:hypothetical protein